MKQFAKTYADGLEAILSQEDVTDAKVLQFAQDYVREVVAHEVGHILGLRHNFVASRGVLLWRSPDVADLKRWKRIMHHFLSANRAKHSKGPMQASNGTMSSSAPQHPILTSEAVAALPPPGNIRSLLFEHESS